MCAPAWFTGRYVRINILLAADGSGDHRTLPQPMDAAGNKTRQPLLCKRDGRQNPSRPTSASFAAPNLLKAELRKGKMWALYEAGLAQPSITKLHGFTWKVDTQPRWISKALD